VYFVLFGLCGNTIAIPELVSYLIDCRGQPEKRGQFFSPWHPFFHAATALAILTNNQIAVPTEDEEELDTFFERVKQWK
jgi:hypothetical protein